MKNINQLQQGDVLLKRVSVDLSKAKVLHHVVLAEGEATGHAHRVSGGGAKLVELDGERYLVTPEGVELYHEEHKPVTIPPGQWHVSTVREYDWLVKLERKVID